jgi:hypothetical protein
MREQHALPVGNGGRGARRWRLAAWPAACCSAAERAEGATPRAVSMWWRAVVQMSYCLLCLAAWQPEAATCGGIRG